MLPAVLLRPVTYAMNEHPRRNSDSDSELEFPALSDPLRFTSYDTGVLAILSITKFNFISVKSYA